MAKGLHPSLSCGDLENGDAELEKVLYGQFRLWVKCPGGSRQNVPTPVPDITNVTAFIRISLSFDFTFTDDVKFISLSKLWRRLIFDGSSAPRKLPCRFRLRNPFQKFPVELKDVRER